MKFVPYILLVVSFVAGFVGIPYVVIGVTALLSFVCLAAKRRQQLKTQPQAPDQNMLIDGAFLLVQQVLIHFFVFALGLFLAYVSGNGVQF